MISLRKLALVTASAVFFIAPALAQNAGSVTNHAFVIGAGPNSTGYTSLLCGSAQLAVGQAAADPICQSISGDVTLSAAGAVTLATVNGNVGSFGSTTQCTSITVNAKGLITAASQATCAPAVGSITGLGTGIATWLGTPSSANLRAAITDETGIGLAYFQGGDIGTPSAGVATNLTGTAAGLTAGTFTAGSASNLNAGTLPAARTNGHMNGTATNDNGAAGEVSEFITSNVARATNLSSSTGVAKNITSISLTAGDWNVFGICGIAIGTAMQAFSCGISTTTGTLPGLDGGEFNLAGIAFTGDAILPTPHARISISGTTTVFLVTQNTFTGVSTIYGTLSARRAR